MSQPRQELKTSLPGNPTFVAGEDGCTRIEQLAGGAGYEVHRGSQLIKVPEHKVELFTQDPRPGYELEQRDAANPLPSFVIDAGDGTYDCKRCGKRGFRSVQGLKVHFGREHGGERDA